MMLLWVYERAAQLKAWALSVAVAARVREDGKTEITLDRGTIVVDPPSDVYGLVDDWEKRGARL